MMYDFSYECIYFFLPIIGFIIALVGTMIGGGGGFFFFPILTMIYDVPASTAVITSLLSTIPICLTGSISYYRKNEVNVRVGLILSVFGIIGSIIGIYITGVISSSVLKSAFGAYSICMAISLCIKAYNSKSDNTETMQPSKRNILRTSGLGVSAGIITGSFGTSGSSPILTALFGLNLPIQQVMGTSLLVVLINTLIASSIHLTVTQVSVPILLLITLGSIPGAFMGPRLFTRKRLGNKSTSIKYVYASVIGIIGIVMFIQ